MEKSNLSERQLVTLSKALSKILRHDAAKMGISIQSDGYCPLDQVLANIKGLKPTKYDVEQVVESNNKKRFEMIMKENQTWIRAVQGHTMQTVKDEDLLTPINDKKVFQFKKVIHGTYK